MAEERIYTIIVQRERVEVSREVYMPIIKHVRRNDIRIVSSGRSRCRWNGFRRKA